MSYAVHSKPLDALEWGDVQELVDREAEESATLEFKGADIWDERAGKRGPQKAALPAIVAFANAYGGVLVLGMREERGPPGVAAELQPVADAPEKLEALQRAASDAIDPPLQGLAWKAVMAPDEDGRGVIVARVPASHLAPHGFGKPPETYVRRFASSEPMTMRDLHNVFWEARTRQERIVGIRRQGDLKVQKVRSDRGLGLLREWSGGQQVVLKRKGVFIRCSAIHHDLLAVPIEKLMSVSIPISENVGMGDRLLACEVEDRKLPLPRGITYRGLAGAQLSVDVDGVVEAVGFEPSDPHDDKYYVHAIDHLGLFSRVALMAYYLGPAAGRPGAPFEIDMRLEVEEGCDPIFDQETTRPRYGNGLTEFSIGPFLITDRTTFKSALQAAQVEIYRGFGSARMEPSPRAQNLSVFDAI